MYARVCACAYILYVHTLMCIPFSVTNTYTHCLCALPCALYPPPHTHSVLRVMFSLCPSMHTHARTHRGVPLLEGFSAFSATVLALTFIFGNAAK